MKNETLPLVSCIMPTYDRRSFIPHAIRYFLQQDYPNKELIIIDDGSDCIQDLVPELKNIHYYRLHGKITLGAKLNLACTYAKGNIVAHWDDDDWYASRRLSYQVTALQQPNTHLCGLNKLLYYDVRHKKAYTYTYPPDQRVWLLGSSLCYDKTLWSKHRFADINVGMDGLFVWAASPNEVLALPDTNIAVHLIHETNVSPKKTEGAWWQPLEPETIRKIMAKDWMHYSNGIGRVPQEGIHSVGRIINASRPKTLKVRNVYACLVHEKEETIIDLVRNLHYHDPDSPILLYNGSNNKGLLRTDFPYAQFNAVIHPNTTPVAHGYLHTYALDAMQFCLDHIPFDTMTIVDSDQLCLRSGYADYLGQFLQSNGNTGMLSSRSQQVLPGDKATEVWPAAQAFNEFGLWKPFLHQFPGGESRFVHWTFWPSTVFTFNAARDLTKLFRQNKLLQQVMKLTKIWATEEVILPTLTRLLGYDISMNPCSYEFVKYQHTFSVKELNSAFSNASAFWIHPVNRQYNNELRSFARQRCNHYSQTPSSTHANKLNDTMVTTFSLINKIKNIEGWLEDKEADLLVSSTIKACNTIPAPQAIVEVGSYHGKSTVLLGSVVKEYFPAAKVYAIDPHEGEVGAADEGIQQLAPSLDMFNKNVQEAGVANHIESIKNYSFKVHWEKPIALLFIDGLHDYPNVAKDFWHFSEYIVPGGFIAFHDYADYYPGVVAFVDELLLSGEYARVGKAESLVVVQKNIASFNRPQST